MRLIFVVFLPLVLEVNRSSLVSINKKQRQKMTALMCRIESVLMTSVETRAVMLGSFAQKLPAMSINTVCQKAGKRPLPKIKHKAKIINSTNITALTIKLVICPAGKLRRSTIPAIKANRLSQIIFLHLQRIVYCDKHRAIMKKVKVLEAEK